MDCGVPRATWAHGWTILPGGHDPHVRRPPHRPSHDPRDHDELPLSRLEAFSDGVFAIAITIIVLELAVEPDAGQHLLRSIADEWPSYLAYVTSFLTIGVVWMQHSAITGTLRAADANLYRINLLLLLLASFLPFPTKLAAEYLHEPDAERVAVVFYGLVLFALVLALTWFGRYATRDQRLVREDVDAERVEARFSQLPSFTLYVVGIVVGLLAPTAAVIVYLVSALLRGLPVGAVRRFLGGLR